MKNWEKTLVKPSTPIRKVIETIERGEHQIALVVGANSKFLGTVTDGDIRRGILRGVRLEEAVQKVMHTAAVTAVSPKRTRAVLQAGSLGSAA